MSEGIPPKILKEYRSVVCEPLTKIINKGIVDSNFDDNLKKADLTPVHKEGDTTNKKNFRNISLLDIVSKFFVKILQTQITAHMEKFLSPYLCGYRKGFNPQHALISMLEKWKAAIDKQGYGGGVLMDLSKAFDTLDHDLLIAKLHAYGFDINALKLVKSYLTNRWQRTRINDCYSSWSELIKGVPQGSVLGPLLFNLYINDLFFLVHTDLCNYADDNTPHTCDMHLDKLMSKLENVTEEILDWFDYNGMKLNDSKCKLLVTGYKFESMICKVGNSNIIESHNVKLLGLLIDSKLSFDSHMDKLCRKASQKLNALSRLCPILPFHYRKMLVQSFFNSHFCYCPLVWMFHSREVTHFLFYKQLGC